MISQTLLPKTWEVLWWRHEIYDVFLRKFGLRATTISGFFHYFTMQFNIFFFNLTWEAKQKQSATWWSLCSSSVCLSVRLSVRLSYFLFAYYFFTLRDMAFIFGMFDPYDTHFPMVLNFDHVTFDLHLENFNSAHYFLALRHRALIFGMCVPYNKTFIIVP